jgi:hypothetical protein
MRHADFIMIDDGKQMIRVSCHLPQAAGYDPQITSARNQVLDLNVTFDSGSGSEV